MTENPAPARRALEAVLYADDLQLARCLLRRGRYIIGSERKNEIIVDEPSVSAQHARLSVRSDEEIFLEDLDSANGTFVDGQPAEGAVRLQPGAQVHLGSVELCLERLRLPAAVFDEVPAEFLRPQPLELGEIIVQGSTSTIHRAHDATLDREVAVKVLLPRQQRDAAAVLRFVREAQIAAQLQHPGILPVYELGLNPAGQLFYTTRFIEGESLGSILDRLAAGEERAAERFSVFALIALWQKLCDTVAFAHSRGVVHNSLTPDAVEIGRFGEVFVTQWTAALVSAEEPGETRAIRVPQATAAAPLTAYAAPEQAAGLVPDIDARSDVFALGGILYRILTLRPPLAGDTDEALLEAALQAAVIAPAKLGKNAPRSRVPEFPAAVAMKALSYAREDRHQSVPELQAEIAAWQDGTTSGADLGRLWKQFTGLLRPH
jgi:hypothetical protein